MSDVVSPKVIGNPFLQVSPNAEPVVEEVESITFDNRIKFYIDIFIKYTRLLFFDDEYSHNNNNIQALVETEDSMECMETLEISAGTLVSNDNNSRSTINGLLRNIHVPSSLSASLTEPIINCGCDMWKDYCGLNDNIKLKIRVEVDAFVDELPYDLIPFDEDEHVEIHFVAASKSAIESLKRLKIGHDGGENSCSICLENFLVGRSEAIKLPCSHLFHGDCIIKWLGKSKYCPLCRFEMPA